jgi:hypothetical protein
MRRGAWVAVVLLLILVGVGAGIGGYNAGVADGIERSGGEVVRVVGHGYGFGFPFGLILFPLFFFGVFFLLRAAFWRGPAWGGPGHWGPRGGPAGVEEWHRRLHEEGRTDRTTGDTGTA